MVDFLWEWYSKTLHAQNQLKFTFKIIYQRRKKGLTSWKHKESGVWLWMYEVLRKLMFSLCLSVHRGVGARRGYSCTGLRGTPSSLLSLSPAAGLTGVPSFPLIQEDWLHHGWYASCDGTGGLSCLRNIFELLPSTRPCQICIWDVAPTPTVSYCDQPCKINRFQFEVGYPFLQWCTCTGCSYRARGPKAVLSCLLNYITLQPYLTGTKTIQL